jgi:nitrogen fixation protein FixH
MADLRPAYGGEFTGKHMLLLTLGFFGVILAVNIGMATVAMTSWTGLVVNNSYVASQEFEAKRLAHDGQLAAGWHASFSYTPGAVTLVVVDGTGEPVNLGPVTLTVNRPVGGHDDQTLALEQSADGRYLASLELKRGVWEVVVTAPSTPEGSFELHRRFAVEEPGK